jgi:hypothetical protein
LTLTPTGSVSSDVDTPLCILDSRHDGSETRRAARTGFWLSLFRFQGAAGHLPLGGGARLSFWAQRTRRSDTPFSRVSTNRRNCGRERLAGCPRCVNVGRPETRLSRRRGCPGSSRTSIPPLRCSRSP